MTHPRKAKLACLLFLPLAACSAAGGEPDPGGAGGGSKGPDQGTEVDVDGDGVIDGIDTDGDGIIDGVDTDGDGVVDLVDTDGDGILDGDGDGEAQVICTEGVPSTSQLPRLTGTEFDNTIQDLLGLSFESSTILTLDRKASVDKRAWEGYKTLASDLAAEVLSDSKARQRVMGCEPSGDGRECAAQVIEEFGLRAFRRPLSEDEVARFMKLFDAHPEVTETGTIEEGFQLLVEGFLLSPSFVMQSELEKVADGDRFALTGYEVASRLSYMLWATMPDDELFRAAGAGELATEEQIRAQALRMLTDQKAKGQVRAAHIDYLDMWDLRWFDMERDPVLFPDFNQDLIPLITEETLRFVDHIVFDQEGSYQDLLTTPVGFVNKDLAPLYGLKAADYGDDLVAVDLNPEERSGLLTRIGFLAVNSVSTRTSPIRRGGRVLSRVLCSSISVPPPEASLIDHKGTPLPTEGLTTTREQVTAQTEPTECKSCHASFIDPIGFAMESYDAIGAYREADNGAPVDTTATIQIGQNLLEIDGPIELSEAVANAPEAHVCYAKNYVQFAYRRNLTDEDACTMQRMTAKLTEGGYTIVDLIVDLTQSESFRYRTVQ